MKPIKANEWADLALKKDVETIKRRMLSKQFVILLICVDISLASFSTLISNYNTINIALKVFLYFLISAPLVCPIITFVKFVCNIFKARNGKFSTKEYVDVFDNSICYWVMMSSSFLDDINDDNQMPLDEKMFCLQEINYYVNKSIKVINHIALNLSAIVCDKYEEAFNNHKISIYRLITVINLLISLRIRCDSILKDIKNEIGSYESITQNDGDNAVVTTRGKRIEIINKEEEYNKIMNEVLDKVIKNINLDFGLKLKNMSEQIAQISSKATA